MLAAQIRANFESLVRASPSPLVRSTLYTGTCRMLPLTKRQMQRSCC